MIDRRSTLTLTGMALLMPAEVFAQANEKLTIVNAHHTH